MKLCILLFGLLLFSHVDAAVYDHYFRPPAWIDSYGYAHYKLYIPDACKAIRGVYCFIPGWQCSAVDVVDDSVYQNFVEKHDLALLGFEMLGNYTTQQEGVSRWSGQALLDALTALAATSGYTELADAPLLLDGHSAGGQFAFHFTQWQPQRVLALVCMKGGYHNMDISPQLVNVPALLFIGSADLGYRQTNLTNIFYNHRALGAPWALAIQPGAGHDRVGYPMVHTFFQTLLAKRLPRRAPMDVTPQLMELPAESGFLADLRMLDFDPFAEFTGNVQRSCWLPSEQCALQWQDFMQGKPFELHAPEPDYTESADLQILAVYPNPADNVLHLRYEIVQPTFVKICLYNILGQFIMDVVNSEQDRGEHEAEIQVASLINGAYYVVMQVDGAYAAQPFSVCHK